MLAQRRVWRAVGKRSTGGIEGGQVEPSRGKAGREEGWGAVEGSGHGGWVARPVTARDPWLPCWTAPFTVGLSSFTCDPSAGAGGSPSRPPLPSF